VVGNSNYGGDLGVLANPVNDARLVAESLKKIGFDVIEVEDADQNALKRAIAAFGDRMASAGSEATSLFFYAGHGLQVGGQNYLIPVQAKIARERDVDIEAISLDTVLKQMAWAESKVNIVILDACRNNPLSRGFRSTTQGLAEITVKPQGSFISYSTAPGDVAVDGNGSNSPFSAAFAEAIEKPGLDINDVFREVRADVMAATKGAGALGFILADCALLLRPGRGREASGGGAGAGLHCRRRSEDHRAHFLGSDQGQQVAG
jgi:carboxyl-terminal processing protease